MLFSNARRKPTDIVDISTAQGNTTEHVTFYRYIPIWLDECLSLKQNVANLVKELRLKFLFLDTRPAYLLNKAGRHHLSTGCWLWWFVVYYCIRTVSPHVRLFKHPLQSPYQHYIIIGKTTFALTVAGLKLNNWTINTHFPAKTCNMR